MWDDVEQPRRAITHAVGEPLEALSIAALDERLHLLRAEIERLEVARRLKQVARDHAGSIFRS